MSCFVYVDVVGFRCDDVMNVGQFLCGLKCGQIGQSCFGCYVVVCYFEKGCELVDDFCFGLVGEWCGCRMQQVLIEVCVLKCCCLGYLWCWWVYVGEC